MVELINSIVDLPTVFETQIRKNHSKTRKRFIEDQYNLDLTVITP